MENTTDTAPRTVAQTALAPVMERFAVPLMWFAAGYIVCRLTRPSRKAVE